MSSYQLLTSSKNTHSLSFNQFLLTGSRESNQTEPQRVNRPLSSPFQFTSKNELLSVTLIMDFAEVRLNHRITLVMLTLVLHHDIHNFMIKQNPLIR